MSAEDDAEFLKRFSTALERKGGTNTACPVCEKTARIVDPRQIVLLKSTSPELDPENVQHDAAVANVCGNCGLARFHIRSVLLDEHDTPSITPTSSKRPAPTDL